VTFSTRAEVIARRTYNRPLNDEGTVFETWEQTVDRVIGHQRWLWLRAAGQLDVTAMETELEELRALMLARKVTVSGRTLWLGGTSISKTREASQFNCSFLRVSTVSDIADSFWLLLQGCGVGFEPIPGTLNGFTNAKEIEIVPSTRTDKGGAEKNKETVKNGVWTIKIGDSAEAWSKAAAKVMANKTSAKKLVLDFSEIRPAGQRLKGYGWISSGWEPFAKALENIAALMNQRAGNLLTRIDILDIMNHLGTTLSSRRSAEIALVPWADPEAEAFAVAKRNWWEPTADRPQGNPQRQQSNNSLMFYSRPSKYELAYVFQIMERAGGSEPGFINAQAAAKRAPWFKGCNPCVTGETPLLTRNGYLQIRDVVGKDVEIWNGDRWSAVKPFSTGINPLVKVVLSDGTELDCTPYHKFVVQDGYNGKPHRLEARELQPGQKLAKFDMPIVERGFEIEGDAYSQGFYSGDGNTDLNHSWVYEPKMVCADRLVGEVGTLTKYGRATWKHGPMRAKDFVPLDASLRYRRDWFAGLMDADGTVVSDVNGDGMQLASIDRAFLMQVRLLLTTMGVQAKLNLMHRDGRESDHPNFVGYKSQDCWRLLINQADTYRLMNDVDMTFERLQVRVKPPQRDARRFVTVEQVIDLGTEVETFCVTEPFNNTVTFNGIVTGNCAEILLGDKSFCNLIEVDLAKFNGDENRLHTAMYLAARANYRQTCVDLRDEVLQASWHELNNFLRLCGAGSTGIVGWEYHQDAASIRLLGEAAREGSNSMADELGLPRPKATTTIKPSGTLSKIMDTTEGIHKPLGRYIFNNVNFSKHDPVVQKLRDAGYRVFENPTDSTAVLVTFPVAWENVEFDVVDGKHVNLETAVSQLDRYKLWMDNYVDHNCSITVSYSPDEVPAIIDWLIENWEHYVGVSFIYRNDPTKTAADLGYLYLPQEVVTQEVFEAYASTLGPVTLDDQGAGDVDDADCASGACPIR